MFWIDRDHRGEPEKMPGGPRKGNRAKSYELLFVLQQAKGTVSGTPKPFYKAQKIGRPVVSELGEPPLPVSRFP